MNKRTDNEQLLADVLAPEADSGFSAALLAETLHQARQRRRFRQIRRYGGALAVLAVVLFISSRFLGPGARTELARLPQSLSYQLVFSQPLTSGQVIRTRSLAPNQSVSSTTTALVIQTAPGGFGEIGDDELMALAAPQVVALVRRGPNAAELIFVSSSPEDSDSRQN